MAEVIFDKVEKVYDNDVHAVHDLSLEIGRASCRERV